MTDTIANYTDEMVTSMTETYSANPTLDTAKSLAADMGKSTKSVVAKLVSLGIYKKAEKKSKSGNPVIQKATLVKQIETHYGFALPSLIKATKTDLQNMVDNLS